MNTLRRTLAAALLLAPAGAFAHNNDDHGKKPGAIKKEQKAWGIAGDLKAVKRVIQVGMTDNMRFTPDAIEVRQGETVRFVIRNSGQVMHEFVLGTKPDLNEHAALMVKFPNMEHDEPYMAHVGPGKTGEIVWHFNRAGDFDFACLIAGHYQAGMVGKIKVVAATGATVGGHSGHKH
ncbi:MAG: cupredoxin family protein [Rubrivivax sp.]|nr:cupredoxin family protein [Rubrivivax sp.]